jgi:plastocyanin
MKKIIALVAVSVGTLLLSGCGSSQSGQNMPNNSLKSTQAQNQSTNQPAVVEGNAVKIQNFAFDPGTLTVKKGTTVTWTNNDSAPHQIKSATFNSSQLSKGQAFSFTFNETGTFDYSCSIHPSMLGKIIVQ